LLANEAQERISISSLYLGTGKLEEFLVDKLKHKLKSTEHIKVSILLDYMRGTREGRNGKSSLKMLKGLKDDFYDK